ERSPFTLGDLEMFVRFAHGTAGVGLGATRGPADHLGHVVLEARRADTVMRFINGCVCIQDRVAHNPINEVVHYAGNRVDATEPLVERVAWAIIPPCLMWPALVRQARASLRVLR